MGQNIFSQFIIGHGRNNSCIKKKLYNLCRYRLYETVYDCPDPRYDKAPLFGHLLAVVRTGTVNVGDMIYIQSQ